MKTKCFVKLSVVFLLMIFFSVSAKDTFAQSCGFYGKACTTDSNCCSAYLCNNGMCSSSSNILLNEALNTSCQILCEDSGYANVASWGTDSQGTNKFVYVYDHNNSTCVLSDVYDYPWYGIFDQGGAICGGRRANWTYCNCTNPVSPPTPTPTPTPLPTPTPPTPTPTIIPTVTPTPEVLLNVPIFKQTDFKWGGLEYDSGNSQSLWCGKTIGNCGCALSSIAMILKYYGIDKDDNGNLTDPETVNNYFKRGEKCISSRCISLGYTFGNIHWSAADQYSAEANKLFGSQKIIFTGMKNYYDSDFVENEIDKGRPVALRVPGREHWIVAKGIQGDSFTINDPYYTRISLNDPAYQDTALAMRGYEKTSSDFSRFEVTSLAPTQILVTDSQGRKTGYDLEFSGTKEEIPNSTYTFEASYADPTGESPTPPFDAGVYTVMISTPEQGEYKVEVVSVPNQLYSFAVYGSGRDAGLDFNLFENTAESNKENVYTFTYNPEPGQKQFVENVAIKVEGLEDLLKQDGEATALVKVIMYSSATFSAPETINKESLTFGKVGNEQSLFKCKKEADLNRDGLDDLICQFRVNKGDFVNGDNTVVLGGVTENGVEIEGHGVISIH